MCINNTVYTVCYIIYSLYNILYNLYIDTNTYSKIDHLYIKPPFSNQLAIIELVSLVQHLYIAIKPILRMVQLLNFDLHRLMLNQIRLCTNLHEFKCLRNRTSIHRRNRLIYSTISYSILAKIPLQKERFLKVRKTNF